MKILIVTILVLALGAGIFFLMQQESEPKRTTPIKIVAFGDSLTAGYGVAEEENYPSQLKKALSEYQIDMINLGVSGDTTESAKERLQQVIDAEPDIVLLGIGGNDALRLLPIAQAKANIESMVQRLKSQANPPRIILLEMQTGIHGGLPYKREFDAIYQDIAEAHNIPLVPFIVAKIYLDQAYMLSDRIHMNREGYAYIVREYLKSAVEKEIRRLQ